ncbi:30S ribosomal protein S9 [Candidatus Pacearchaeota archaeon]|nr:30S ribosomal protein S9 [Candidatus Pacearchaeota archaeon]
MAEKLIIVSGKRKTSIAKAIISSGTGKITVNNIPYQNLYHIHRLTIEEPIRIAKKIVKDINNYDIKVKARGGGREGQMDASRLAISKALVAKTKSEPLRKAFLKYDRHLLVADTRRKEAYKPGDSKARAKRQKSYR